MILDKDQKQIIKMAEGVENHPKYKLFESGVMDYMIIFALAKKFSTPFNKTDAFKYGIIDQSGNILKSPSTSQEKNAFTPLDNLVTRIKKLIPNNLLYLLTFAYIFKGFSSSTTYKSMYEGCETEDQMLIEEEKRLALTRTKEEVKELISKNSKFTEEEYWSFVAEKHD
jgi:hypothetical protein